MQDHVNEPPKNTRETNDAGRLSCLDWNSASPAQRTKALARPAMTDQANLDREAKVRAIIERVRTEGDHAIKQLTQQFDGVRVDELEVPAKSLRTSLERIDTSTRSALEQAIENIESFHSKQLPEPIRVEVRPGQVCEKHWHPIEKVGFYIPGGRAPLPSTVLMTAVPARIAGCSQRILTTPPNGDGDVHDVILAAAQLCGVERVFKAGGAQAIAAMAFGSQSLPAVDKIYGPGNAWVTAAKQLVAQSPDGAAIDMPAGPSEVCVIADEHADPEFVAIDLLSQAEHGPDSQVLLITVSSELASRVEQCIERLLPSLNHRDSAEQALRSSRCILTTDIEQACMVSEIYAPEHLILQVKQPRQWLGRLKKAGSIFLGSWTPESVGDYASGTNHVLPTYGWARAYSGLGLSDFLRSYTVQELTQEALIALAPSVEQLASIEGLDAHRLAVQLRRQRLTENGGMSSSPDRRVPEEARPC